MKYYWFVLLLFIFSESLRAQLRDDFSDGNLSNPDWTGSTNQFVINSAYQLQLNNTIAATSFLSTPFSRTGLDNMEWNFFVRQSFSPSGNNYGRVYLVSTESDLTKPLNGYYLQFGEAGSNDAVQLFEQTGSTSTSVCRARNTSIAASFAVRIKVTRDAKGLWSLWIDYSGGTNWTLEASGSSQIHSNSSFFGILCVYTASNATKFYYDDFYAGPLVTDTMPPALDSVQVVSSRSIRVEFTEQLDPASALDVLNYSVDHDAGNPVSTIILPDSAGVVLGFANDFKNGFEHELKVSGIKDRTGNAMTESRFLFLYFQPSVVNSKDIIISEILADPVPQIGLPAAEFVEIYNRSNAPISLESWKISDRSTDGILPAAILQPGEYAILTSSANASQYTPFGRVISPTGFPSLNNDSDTLKLISVDGHTIDSLNYDLSWYRETSKQEGGYSLELIDPNNPCGEEDNWTSSDDPSGGTPGKANSVSANKPDVTGPMLIRAVPVNSLQLILAFNEKLDTHAPTEARISLTPSVPIRRTTFSNRSMREISIELASPLSFGKAYVIIAENVRDCNLNTIQEGFKELQFALPEEADSLDIIINEILFNPRPGGSDFLEMYNHSRKYISLKNWKIANLENGVLTNLSQISDHDLIISPESYLAIASDRVRIESDYPGSLHGNLFESPLPGFPDDEGSAVLVSDKGKVIDYLQYNKDFHSPLLQDDEGVSLERISFSSPVDTRQNWKSATTQSGFATPGYLNSNARPEIISSHGRITIEPEVISPGSGFADFARIDYDFDQAGYIANIKIFDEQGHFVKTIANNEILGFEGFFRWDGVRENGDKARMGYYAVWAEVFNTSGDVITFRKRVVVFSR